MSDGSGKGLGKVELLLGAAGLAVASFGLGAFVARRMTLAPARASSSNSGAATATTGAATASASSVAAATNVRVPPPPPRVRFATPYFATGQYESTAQRRFLPDAIYTHVLDGVTKATNDILVTRAGYPHRILLGQRCVYPQRDWWYGCGGRVQVGECTHDSTQRLLKRELNITIPSHAQVHSGAPSAADSKRADDADADAPLQPGVVVETVGHYSFAWRMRQQAPQSHGTCDISVVTCVALSDTQLAGLALDTAEYAARAWVSVARVLRADPALAWTEPALRLIGFDRTDDDATDDASDATDAKSKSQAAALLPTVYHPALVRGVVDYVRLRLHKLMDSLVDADVVPACGAASVPASTATTAGAAPGTAAAAIAPNFAAVAREYALFCRFASAADHSKVQVDNFL